MNPEADNSFQGGNSRAESNSRREIEPTLKPTFTKRSLEVAPYSDDMLPEAEAIKAGLKSSDLDERITAVALDTNQPDSDIRSLEDLETECLELLNESGAGYITPYSAVEGLNEFKNRVN